MTTALKEIYEILPHIKKLGSKNIWFDLDDGTFLRLRGKKVVGITITNFSKKFKE